MFSIEPRGNFSRPSSRSRLC